MSTKAKEDKLRSCLKAFGNDWLLRSSGHDAEKYLHKLANELDSFSREYRKRFGEAVDPYLLVEENPIKAAAFFQVDTLLLSTEMKIMVWRLLLGCEITAMNVRYQAGRHFEMSISLRLPYGDHDEQYRSSNPSDLRALRYLGLIGMDGQWYLQGYYGKRRRNGE